MRIGQLAARTGLTTKTIRFYESTGVLPEPERRPSGYRHYDEAAVDRLGFIRAAQAAGLSLAEIRNVITVRDSGGAPCQHVLALLNTHAADLDRRIAELTHLREQVDRLRSRASTLDPATCSPADICQLIPLDAVPHHDGATSPSRRHSSPAARSSPGRSSRFVVARDAEPSTATRAVGRRHSVDALIGPAEQRGGQLPHERGDPGQAVVHRIDVSMPEVQVTR